MREIEIRNIKEEPVDLYNPHDIYLGTIYNVLQFNDVLVQIKRDQRTGYYIKFLGEKIDIDRNGTLRHYPRGLFDLYTNLLTYLVLE